MLVKLSNDWFDGQTYHKKGVTFEYHGKEEDLPNGAVILSENGTLPVGANRPKAGHGAKPVEEQIMDMVGGTDNHQQSVGGGEGSGEGVTKAPADEQKVLDEAVAKAAEADKKVQEANDPLAFLETPAKKSK